MISRFGQVAFFEYSATSVIPQQIKVDTWIEEIRVFWNAVMITDEMCMRIQLFKKVGNR
jgi:hypothetical protein